jgi:hypothetical protein
VNNLSTSLAQQKSPSSDYKTSSSSLLPSARSWALKALDLASQIPPQFHTPECSIGCAVATHNLGEIAEMSGDLEEARRRYKDARGLAEKAGFGEGVERAGKALKRLNEGLGE